MPGPITKEDIQLVNSAVYWQRMFALALFKLDMTELHITEEDCKRFTKAGIVGVFCDNKGDHPVIKLMTMESALAYMSMDGAVVSGCEPISKEGH